MGVDRGPSAPDGAPQVQEAIDTILQSFDHPRTLSLQYTSDEGIKRTRIEVTTHAGAKAYELVYDGRQEDQEPELSRVE